MAAKTDQICNGRSVIFLHSFLTFAHKIREMKKICYFISAALLLSFIGCGHQPMTKKLADIDSLIIKEQYDSASAILNSLSEKAMTEEDKAHYYLLATQLGYVTNHPLPSDSMLNIALTYYNKVGNNQKLADAYYYKSARSRINQDYPQAILYCKEAERLADQSKDIRLQYKIAENLACLNSFCENDLLQLHYAKKALGIAFRVHNNIWLAYSYNRISFAFANLNQLDSAYFYTEKTRPFIDYIDDPNKAVFLMNMGLLYKDNDPQKAKDLFVKALEYDELPLTLEHLADVYYDEGNKEKAYSLWKKALTISGGEGYEKDNLIHSIISYDLERGNIDDVSKNVDEIINIKDSILNKLKNDTIKDLQLRFDQEVAVNAANERLIRWQWYSGAIVIIGLLLIGLWLRKRHHLKTMLAKRQIEIQSLVLQVDHKKNEVAKYENRIAQLQTEQLKDNETKEELKAQIEKLTRQKDEAQSDFLLLSQKMQEWTGAEVEKLRQGILLMANVEEGKCVKNWSDDELKSLINYYCAVHTDFAKTIYKDHQNLSARQCLYLMLVDMKKTEDETSDIMGVAKDSLRSYRFQIKQKANKRQ